MISLTPQQWEKFRRYVQPGCLCRSINTEGILLENWPYGYLESWIELAEIMTSSDVSDRDSRKDHYLRFQPFNLLVVVNGYLPIMSFFIGDRWRGVYSILALTDE